MPETMRTLQAILTLTSLVFFFANSVIPAQAAPLRFRLPGEPVTLDWNLAHTSNETPIIMNIMEGLTEYGPDLQPRPALAKKWDISADGKTYHFWLRSDVLWSDGKPLRAQDFVDSWLRLLDPKTRSSYASFLFDIAGALPFHQGKIRDASSVGIRAINDAELEVRLIRVVPYFLHIPTFWVTFPIRNDLINKFGSQWSAPKNIVTLGAYSLTAWKKGRSLQLKRNAKYFGAATISVKAPSDIEVIIESNDQQARELFNQAQLDFFQDPTTDDLLKLRNVPAKNIRTQQFPYLATFYLGLNSNHGVLRNVEIRKAITLSINRQKIASTLQGGQLPAKGWIPPGMPGHLTDESELGLDTQTDPRGILAKAGYPDGKGFPKILLVTQKFDNASTLTTFLARVLNEKLGITVESEILATPDYLKALRSGKAALFIGQWGADFPDPENFFSLFTTGNELNRLGWKNPEYDRLIEQARGTLDMNTRLKAYLAAERMLIATDAALLPLFYKRNTALIRDRVEKLEITPLNYLFFKNVELRP